MLDTGHYTSIIIHYQLGYVYGNKRNPNSYYYIYFKGMCIKVGFAITKNEVNIKVYLKVVCMLVKPKIYPNHQRNLPVTYLCNHFPS